MGGSTGNLITDVAQNAYNPAITRERFALMIDVMRGFHVLAEKGYPDALEFNAHVFNILGERFHITRPNRTNDAVEKAADDILQRYNIDIPEQDLKKLVALLQSVCFPEKVEMQNDIRALLGKVKISDDPPLLLEDIYKNAEEEFEDLVSDLQEIADEEIEKQREPMLQAHGELLKALEDKAFYEKKLKSFHTPSGESENTRTYAISDAKQKAQALKAAQKQVNDWLEMIEEIKKNPTPNKDRKEKIALLETQSSSFMNSIKKLELEINDLEKKIEKSKKSQKTLALYEEKDKLEKERKQLLSLMREIDNQITELKKTDKDRIQELEEKIEKEGKRIQELEAELEISIDSHGSQVAEQKYDAFVKQFERFNQPDYIDALDIRGVGFLCAAKQCMYNLRNDASLERILSISGEGLATGGEIPLGIDKPIIAFIYRHITKRGEKEREKVTMQVAAMEDMPDYSGNQPHMLRFSKTSSTNTWGITDYISYAQSLISNVSVKDPQKLSSQMTGIDRVYRATIDEITLVSLEIFGPMIIDLDELAEAGLLDKNMKEQIELIRAAVHEIHLALIEEAELVEKIKDPNRDPSEYLPIDEVYKRKDEALTTALRETTNFLSIKTKKSDIEVNSVISTYREALNGIYDLKYYASFLSNGYKTMNKKLAAGSDPFAPVVSSQQAKGYFSGLKEIFSIATELFAEQAAKQYIEAEMKPRLVMLDGYQKKVKTAISERKTKEAQHGTKKKTLPQSYSEAEARVRAAQQAKVEHSESKQPQPRALTTQFSLAKRQKVKRPTTTSQPRKPGNRGH